ncbi:MAG: phytanoyl-CoA dioxygenase family protein [Candidatus Latescibacterota bacterium]|nr:phytanoyl-CoA dioxygenase family protein [Candidatus Latescibacterota bacterium]
MPLAFPAHCDTLECGEDNATMAMVEMTRVDPLVDSTELLSDPERLRLQAREEGLLFFRSLLDTGKVLDVRQQILELCAAHGWTRPGTDPAVGLSRPGKLVVEGADPRWRVFYADLQKIRNFHALALDDAITKVFKILFGEQVLPHPRNICRVVFPGSATHSTPPHQDNLYIGGSPDTWTAWLPVGDCPVELGGLAVARSSHVQGRLQDREASGPGGRQVDVAENTTWVGGDYQCGDVIILHSLTVHQGRDNLTQDRLRVSCDYRYQPRSHSVREDSLMPHLSVLSWEEIYADWDPEDPVRKYWKQWDLDIVQRQSS